MKENKKQNMGITLIALIVTIIVMLILLAITINGMLDGKLFDKTDEAVDKTNNKVRELENRSNNLMDKLTEVEQKQCTHIYGEWETTAAATCTETGSKKRTCTKCGQVETEEIEALGHNFENGICTRCEENQN